MPDPAILILMLIKLGVCAPLSFQSPDAGSLTVVVCPIAQGKDSGEPDNKLKKLNPQTHG